jgi:O-antigen/teichoic acid export membrane protein
LNLVKTSFYTALSTAITFLTGFVITKVVAVKIGPAGMAYVGQFQNTTAICAMLGVAAINSGVVKYLAQYRGEKEKQQEIITTAISIIFCASFLVSLFVIIFSQQLSENAFHTADLGLIFFLYGLFLTVISLNTLSLAILNGLKEVKKLTIINISASLVGLAFTVSFARTWGLKGVLLASSFAALVVFCINISVLTTIKGISFRPDFKKWNKKIIMMLFGFSLMNIVSGFMAPAAQFSVRSYIIKNFSDQDAGYWQAVTRISDYYLGFITAVLSVYYLPRLSEIRAKPELNKEILNGYKLILPSAGILALMIWFSKGLIIQILFTDKFVPMLPLFKYQLIGDFLKIGSWLLAYLMVSKARIKTFIITEIVFSCSFVALSYWLMGQYGIIGATYSFAINYGIYWLIMWVMMSNYIKKMPDNN